MAVRSYQISSQGPSGDYVTQDYWNESTSSPRGPEGNLILKSNPHTLKRARIIQQVITPSKNGSVVYVPVGTSINDNDFPGPSVLMDQAKIDTIARAKFDGQVRKGRATMGVQIAKYAQTRDMVLGKYQQLKTVIASAYREISKDKTRRDHLIRLHKLQRLTANEVLQIQFGWKNLFSNIRAGLNTVVKDAEIASRWFTAAHGEFRESNNSSLGPYVRSRVNWVGKVRTSVSGQFVIDNPNLYLLDRSGVLSAPAVAWDLVPWSWVVNMFVNTNQLVNSLTDEVGIHWNDVSYTTSARFYRVTEEAYTPAFGPSHDGASRLVKTQFTRRIRTVGHRPPIDLRFRLPELDYTNATIAGAVILQRMKLISWAAMPPRQPRPMNWREIFPPGYTHL